MSNKALEKNYQQKLAEHLTGSPYRPETVAIINRICHVGMVSCETALELIEALEADHLRTDQELSGMDAPDWYDDVRPPMPGEIGGAVCHLTLIKNLDAE